ncbi:MAG TPA: hypothetical protein VF586_16780 [Pyrinomonadaceae bacterium]|jgi:hypothetical protein
MRSKGFLARAAMLAVALFLALPVVTNAQYGRGRRDKDDVFVNGHDARDGRRDGRGPRSDRRRRDRDGDGDYDRRDEYIREQQRAQRRNGGYQRDPRDRDGDGDYDQRDAYIIQQQQRNNGYGNYGGYGDRGTYGNRGYGNSGYGNYTQSQQTALNAGYNEGIKEGRRARSQGGYRNVNDYSAYRNADKDYNSRYGDRYTYQQYFRRGFENGYNDGLNGY